MLTITKLQLIKLHTLLNQLGIMEDKKEFILTASNGRTESSRELTTQEASYLIRELSKYDPLSAMRGKVFSLAYETGIIWGDSDADKKINCTTLDNFLLQRGAVKKPLSKQTHSELIKTINQFIQIRRHNEENQAAKQTKSLLDELNIQSSFKTGSRAIK